MTAFLVGCIIGAAFTSAVLAAYRGMCQWADRFWQ